MSPSAHGHDRIVDALLATDHLRGSSAALGGRPGHKEWLHFSVGTHSVDALINFSIVDDVGPDGQLRATRPRLTWLVHTPAGWRGEVVTFEPSDAELPAGSVAMRIGPNAFALRDGVYTLTAAGDRQAVTFDLTLRPATMPALIHNVDLGDGPPLHWLIAPRLVADGVITVDGVRHEVVGALAYHDHNWGGFRWGGDFAWEWGYALSPTEGPAWSTVFTRMNDRAYHRTRRVGLFVWRDSLQHKVFRGPAVSVRREGVWGEPARVKIPPLLGMARPGTHTGIPARLALEARQGDDRLQVLFVPNAVAQVIVPSDADEGLTVIHEVVGQFEVEGVLHGERLAYETRGIVEFLGG